MEYLKLMRIKHYLKNMLIFIPILFSGNFFDLSMLKISFVAFISFSLIASSIYIINDIKDKEMDSKHKTKCNRPIASGKVSVKNAIILCVFLVLFSLFLLIIFKISIKAIIFLLIYFILNIAYSFGLKNIPLLDIIILVSGFLIRVIYGAAIIDIEISNWLYLTIMSVAFYMGLCKRRNELQKSGNKTRTVLRYYTKDFLDKNMYLFMGMSIVFYSLWTTDKQIVLKSNNLFIWTVPIIIILCMKYNMDVESDECDGDPINVILNDKLLMVMGCAYCIMCFGILYLC